MSNQDIDGSWLPSGTYGNGTGYDMYLWNGATSCWIYKLDMPPTVNWTTVNPSPDFVVGRGYLYSVQELKPSKQFIGNLSNGLVTTALTFSGTEASLRGFNLIGNPYPSCIDWNATSGWTRDDLELSGDGYNMWIWNPAVNNYGVYNSADADRVETNSITKNIASTQGFFVQAFNAGIISMYNAVRAYDSDGNKFKTANQEINKVNISRSSESGFGADEIQLRFGYFEKENGAKKLFSEVLSAPTLYMCSEADSLSVQYLTNNEDYPVIPIMSSPGVNGSYTLTCNFDLSKFETVILEDLQTRSFQN